MTAKLDRLASARSRFVGNNRSLALDEMAHRLGVNRRTAERMSDIVARHPI